MHGIGPCCIVGDKGENVSGFPARAVHAHSRSGRARVANPWSSWLAGNCYAHRMLVSPAIDLVKRANCARTVLISTQGRATVRARAGLSRRGASGPGEGEHTERCCGSQPQLYLQAKRFHPFLSSERWQGQSPPFGRASQSNWAKRVESFSKNRDVTGTFQAKLARHLREHR